jgi:hypothetical protein
METINEPLVKIAPQGASVSSHSPFFAKQSDLNDGGLSNELRSKGYEVEVRAVVAHRLGTGHGSAIDWRA